MAGNALALRSRVLHLGLFYLLGLIAVASRAQGSAVAVRQDDLSVLGWGMADIASPVSKRGVGELLHQLGLR